MIATTPGIELLQDLPVSPIELCHTPLKGTKRQETKDIHQGRHPELVREWARVTGWFSEYVYSRDNRRRITADVLADTGCKLSLQLDPWKIGKKAFIGLGNAPAISNRVAEIAAQLYAWDNILDDILDAIKIIDESETVDGLNDDPQLDRMVLLWRRLWPKADEVYVYNARMVRDDGLFPFVHPLTPGPSACSMYHWDTLINARRLGETINLADRLGLSVIAHVELHRQRAKGGGGKYEPIGHERGRFRDMGAIIKRAGVKIVSLDEVPIINNGHVNKPVVANMGSLIEGMS